MRALSASGHFVEPAQMRCGLFLLLVLALLSQVGRAQSDEVVFDPNKTYHLEIVTWTADRKSEGVTWEWLAHEYERYRPNVRVKKSIQSNETYETWAPTQFVSGTAPDIMQSFPWKAAEWGAEQGHLVPLRKYLNAPNPHDHRDRKRYPTWMSCLYDELVEQNADPYYGEIWTIPIALNTQRFYYNKDIFKRYDLKVPRTFSELGEVCRQVRQRSGGAKVPIAMMSTGAWLDYLGAGVNSNLLDQYDVIKRDSGLTSSEILVAALKGQWDSRSDAMYAYPRLMKKMNDEGWFQPDWTGFDSNQADNLFINGKAAMIREGCWMREGFELRIAGSFEFGVMREPYIDKAFAGKDLGRMLELMASYGGELAITQNCVDRGNLPAALDFLQWMTSPEIAIKRTRMDGVMPSTRDLDRELPPEVVAFKPEVGGRPGGPVFYDALSPAMRTAFEEAVPLYESGEMELPELKDFMMRFQDRFVTLALRDTRESTRAGIFRGARLYARLIYDEKLAQRAAGALPVADPLAVELRKRQADVLRSSAILTDSLTDTEDIITAIVNATASRGGAEAYRHVPLITEERARLLRDLCWAGVALALVGLGIFLMRQRRLSKILHFPEKSIYGFLLPSLLFVLAFSYYPAFSGIYHAFTRWDGGAIDEFTGLANFKELFSDQILAVSVLNLFWIVLVFFIQMAPPLLVAVLIYHLSSERLRYYFRVAFVLPMIVPGVVYWIVWKLLYQPAPSGIFNTILIGLENILHHHGMEVHLAYNWLADPRTSLGAIIFMGFPWVGTLGVLIYLAGLENIDPGLFESAGLDGAGFMRKFRHIELPLLARQIKLNLVLGLIGVMQGYGTILFMTKGGPAYSTTVPGYQMYTEAFNDGRMGYASTIGLAMFVVILLATLASTKAVKPQD